MSNPLQTFITLCNLCCIYFFPTSVCIPLSPLQISYRTNKILRRQSIRNTLWKQKKKAINRKTTRNIFADPEEQLRPRAIAQAQKNSKARRRARWNAVANRQQTVFPQAGQTSIFKALFLCLRGDLSRTNLRVKFRHFCRALNQRAEIFITNSQRRFEKQQISAALRAAAQRMDKASNLPGRLDVFFARVYNLSQLPSQC